MDKNARPWSLDNSRTIITILFALVAMAGQAQTFTPIVEDSIDFVITGTMDHGVGSSDLFSN